MRIRQPIGSLSAMASARMSRASRICEPLTAKKLLGRVREIFLQDRPVKSAIEGPPQIGVCVSGGPDSMALAYLLKQASEESTESNQPEFVPIAFIVNHNARKESKEEAWFVQNQLNGLDIQTAILEMEWPTVADPTSLPDFEMKARQARYRLVAEASIRRKVRHLFLGHHQDDQVETILMRLARNSSISFLGLQGMPEHTNIPCCEDIKGALGSQNSDFYMEALQRSDPPPHIEPLTISFEGGRGETTSRPAGLRIHRPLLHYPKIQLVDFCKTNNVPYVTDKTNYDPTLTLRNAVRYMRTHYALPRALQADSILQLQSWARESTSSLVKRGTDALKCIRVCTFDLRSGLMTICVSKQFISSCENDLEAGANALARLTSVVSPQSKDDEPTLVPRANVEEFLDKIRSSHHLRMTIQQVLIEKQPSRSHKAGDDIMLSLVRPPMRPAEVALAEQSFSPFIQSPEAMNERQRTLIGKDFEDVAVRSGIWSEWVLWDHRFWIRVRSRNPEWLSRVQIRNYRVSDDEAVKQKLKRRWRGVHSILREAAPGKLRYTIPVLIVDDEVSVFPTLNIVVPNLASHDFVPEWEVCYKVIDQPFIDQHRPEIQWRNVDMRRGTGSRITSLFSTQRAR